MNIKQIAIALLVGMLIISCQSKKTETIAPQSEALTTNAMKTDNSVPYIEAQRYFVKNSYTNDKIEELKITTAEGFETIFGAAAVMGENGMPTRIDFSKQYVFAVVGMPTDLETTLVVNNLKKEGESIVLDYQLIEGDKQSYAIQPSLILIVDNTFSGEPKFLRK